LVALPVCCLALQRLETRLSREKYWDQTAYNEEIFFLSHDNYKSPGVRVHSLVKGASPGFAVNECAILLLHNEDM
jgi:hypothetical protein